MPAELWDDHSQETHNLDGFILQFLMDFTSAALLSLSILFLFFRPTSSCVFYAGGYGSKSSLRALSDVSCCFYKFYLTSWLCSRAFDKNENIGPL